jgi:hypothetical protein
MCPAAEDRLRAVAREEFRAADITSRIFTWAGNPPSSSGDHDAPSTVAAVKKVAPRSVFLDQNDADMRSMGIQLGRELAQQVMAELLATAGCEGAIQAMNRTEGSVRVRAAIAELRTSHAPGHDEQPAAGRLIAVIPDCPLGIRDDLGITGSAAENWQPGQRPDGSVSDRDQTLKELDLPDEFSWQLAGLIEDVPVIKTSALSGRVVLLDLARFAQVQLVVSESAALGEPLLDLAEPDEAEVRARLEHGCTGSCGAGQQVGASAEDSKAGLEDRIRDEMLKITIDLRLAGKIRVCDKSGAYILTWEE